MELWNCPVRCETNLWSTRTNGSSRQGLLTSRTLPFFTSFLSRYSSVLILNMLPVDEWMIATKRLMLCRKSFYSQWPTLVFDNGRKHQFQLVSLYHFTQEFVISLVNLISDMHLGSSYDSAFSALRRSCRAAAADFFVAPPPPTFWSALRRRSISKSQFSAGQCYKYLDRHGLPYLVS